MFAAERVSPVGSRQRWHHIPCCTAELLGSALPADMQSSGGDAPERKKERKTSFGEGRGASLVDPRPESGRQD